MLRSIKDFEDCVIGAIDGDIGQVKDFYFDDHAWVIRYLIVDTGHWLTRHQVLISPIAVHSPDWAAHRLPVSITREQVRNSPDIDTDEPVSRQQERQYHGYYGYPNYWGGNNRWGGGPYPYGLLPGRGGFGSENAILEQDDAAFARADEARMRGDDPRLRSCQAVIGYRIVANDGEIGHVQSLIADDETWAIRYIVVNTSNWWLGHQVLVAPEWVTGLSWADQSLALALDREGIRSAPAFDSTKALNRELEERLYQHHGREGYWTADAPSLAER
jgi:hypothetical protein